MLLSCIRVLSLLLITLPLPPTESSGELPLLVLLTMSLTLSFASTKPLSPSIRGVGHRTLRTWMPVMRWCLLRAISLSFDHRRTKDIGGNFWSVFAGLQRCRIYGTVSTVRGKGTRVAQAPDPAGGHRLYYKHG